MVFKNFEIWPLQTSIPKGHILIHVTPFPASVQANVIVLNMETFDSRTRTFASIDGVVFPIGPSPFHPLKLEFKPSSMCTLAYLAKHYIFDQVTA
jgi:hypothetical protein